MAGKSYTVFRRKNSPFYYCRFRLPDGTLKDVSTGCKTKRDAETWSFEQAKNDTPLLKKPKITLSEYAGSDFFAWDGVYCRNRRATGKRINEAQAQFKTAELVRLILPYFGNFKLTDISEREIEKFRNYLLIDRKYAGSSVNKVLSDLQSILRQAKKDGIIKTIPDIEKAASTPLKTKGVLTQDEVRRLFADEKNFPDYLSFCASLLASCTGLRLSEVQAVQLKNINPGGYIDIEKSWNDKLRRLNNTTKSGKVRRVVIPRNVQESLQRLVNMNPYGDPDSFLFFSLLIHNKPIDKKVITDGLYSALDRIGIDPAQRKARSVSMHSFRYFLNSLLIAGKIPLLQVQSMTGHLTDSMSQHYFKPQLEDMQGIRDIQESIFTPSPIATDDPDSTTTDHDTTGGDR